MGEPVVGSREFPGRGEHPETDEKRGEAAGPVAG